MANERLIKILVSDIKEFEQLLQSEDAAAEEFGASGDSAEEKEYRTADWYAKHGMPKLQARLALMRQTLATSSEEDTTTEASQGLTTVQAQVLSSEAMMYRLAAINYEGIEPTTSDLHNRTAIDLFKRAFEIAHRPNDALLIGRVLKEMDNTDAALSYLKQAETLDSDGDIGIEATKLIRDIEATPSRAPSAARSSSSSGCVIATVCLGDERIAPLRRLRDDAIVTEPIARDFFHVFWSRYYEWSPGVARVAAADPAVARHIQWGFLEPWLAWMELAAAMGRVHVADLEEPAREAILARAQARLHTWLEQLPLLMELKAPADSEALWEAFDRFRTQARAAFGAVANAVDRA